jgi:exopolysaccharide biosynthesis polyprenyl glycosylphosphotransferase
VLGVIVTEVGGALDPAVSTPLETSIRHELALRLAPHETAKVSIRLQTEAPLNTAGVDRTTSELCTGPTAHGTSHAAHDLAKRTLDVLGSLALLSVLWPVLLVVAILIKWRSPGPIFFRQVRVGRSARPFTMLKFRTMHVGADHAVHQAFVTEFIRSGGQGAPSGKEPLYKIANDSRVTPLGRFLRKTSLDELPQLWNVLRGDMSLVGPRPPLPYELEQYRRWHWRRVLEAKPGVTGLWQVSGRSRTTFDEMVRLDLRYVRTCSLWTDIRILVATPRAVFSGKGAC